MNDIHLWAIELAIKSSEQANVKHLLEFCCSDIADLDLRNSVSKPLLPKLVVTNPPWDRRLSGNVQKSWESLNQFVDVNICDSGGHLYTLTGDTVLVNNIQLPIKDKISFSAAGVDVQLTGQIINPITQIKDTSIV